MYNEYPDLIYEGLISDSFYTDIVEEGFTDSIKKGFGRLKEIAKKAFDKIIEKLKQFVGNVRKFITNLFNKFKKKDNNEKEEKKEDTKKEEKHKDKSSEENSVEYNSEDTEPENTTDSSDSGYNRNARNQRKRKLNGSYSDNHKKVKVVYKYKIDFNKMDDIVQSFYYIFNDLLSSFKLIIHFIATIEKNEKDQDDQEFIKKLQSKHIDAFVNSVEDGLKEYEYLFEKTDEEIISEIILNYGTYDEEDVKEEMEKSEAKEYVLKYKNTMLKIKEKSADIVKVLETMKDYSVKAFDLIDKKINESDLSKEEKSKLKAFKIAGNKAREQYQKVIRFSSLFISLQIIVSSNITSIKVVEI